MTEKQQQLALTLLGALLVARFIFVPWQHAQDEVLQQVQVSAKRLTKAEQLAEIETEIRQQASVLDSQLEQLEAALPKTPSAEQSVQVAQQLLQSHFEGAGVTVVLFNWQGMSAYQDSKIQRGRATIRLSAPLDALIKSLSELQARYPYLTLSEWMSAEVPTDASQKYEVTITLDLLLQVGQL